MRAEACMPHWICVEVRGHPETSAVSFHPVGLGDQSQATSVGGKCSHPPGHLAGEHNPLNTCYSNWIIPSKRMNLNSHLITYTEIEPRN